MRKGGGVGGGTPTLANIKLIYLAALTVKLILLLRRDRFSTSVLVVVSMRAVAWLACLGFVYARAKRRLLGVARSR